MTKLTQLTTKTNVNYFQIEMKGGYGNGKKSKRYELDKKPFE